MIFPDEYKIFSIINEDGTQDTKIFLYCKGCRMSTVEISNLASVEIDDIKRVLDCVVKINNSPETPLVFGIVELQTMLKSNYKKEK